MEKELDKMSSVVEDEFGMDVYMLLNDNKRFFVGSSIFLTISLSLLTVYISNLLDIKSIAEKHREWLIDFKKRLSAEATEEINPNTENRALIVTIRNMIKLYHDKHHNNASIAPNTHEIARDKVLEVLIEFWIRRERAIVIINPIFSALVECLRSMSNKERGDE